MDISFVLKFDYELGKFQRTREILNLGGKLGKLSHNLIEAVEDNIDRGDGRRIFHIIIAVAIILTALSFLIMSSDYQALGFILLIVGFFGLLTRLCYINVNSKKVLLKTLNTKKWIAAFKTHKLRFDIVNQNDIPGVMKLVFTHDNYHDTGTSFEIENTARSMFSNDTDSGEKSFFQDAKQFIKDGTKASFRLR